MSSLFYTTLLPLNSLPLADAQSPCWGGGATLAFEARGSSDRGIWYWALSLKRKRAIMIMRKLWTEVTVRRMTRRSRRPSAKPTELAQLAEALHEAEDARQVFVQCSGMHTPYIKWIIYQICFRTCAQPRGVRRARTEECRDHLRELSARRLVRPRRPRRQKGAADGADKSSTMWSGSRQGN